MTEDILFDNIYVGNSVEEAKALADETYFVKKALEEEAKKAAVVDEDEPETSVDFKEDPVTYIRQKIYNFMEAAKVDPIFAFKAHPETGAGIVLILITFLGMLGALFGLIGGAQKPITKVCLPIMSSVSWYLRRPSQSVKKTDAPVPDDKAAKAKTDATPTASAGGDKKADTPVTKRK